jgi:uncharacterized protein YecT (DUF1311 family)
MNRLVRAACRAVALLPLAGCAIHHVTQDTPGDARAPQTADGAAASTDCFEAGTAAETSICADPALLAADRAMTRALQADLRQADLFARDALLASQRAWLLALPDQCHLADTSHGGAAIACLGIALQGRTATLRGWLQPGPHVPAASAIAHYVAFAPAAGAGPQPDPALCASLAQRADRSLRATGSVDPAAVGAEEIAGTHGPLASEADPRHRVAVDLYEANVFGLFQRRARSVSLDGAAPVITPTSLTALVQSQSRANQGGRFSAFASQTGDYGALDVFRLDGRLLVLATDPWGFTTPAPPGEAAHAGLWDISGAAPIPACLFDIYTRPADPGPFGSLLSFTPWRGLLDRIRDSQTLQLPVATRRDQAQLTADTDFVLLHMPLLSLQQANIGGWIGWLRHRHDQVLDTLFAWSARDPANTAMFDRVFALLRPAAQDLVRAYQTSQALTATEATQAAGLAVMEFLYQSTETIAPAIGSSLAAPADAAPAKPRYPILAVPQ